MESPVISPGKIPRLMERTTNVRNVCLLGCIGHGKSTLLTCMASRYSIQLGDDLSTKDRQDNGSTTKSIATSLYYSSTSDDDINNNQSFWINMMDTSGHTDLIHEATAALRVVDGALVIVDCMENIPIQTESVLRQALDELVKPIIVINKLDRSILDMKLGKEDLYMIYCRTINSINTIIKSKNAIFDFTVSPLTGTVVFTCGLDGWGFTLEQFADRYARKFGVDKQRMVKKLWGDHFYNTQCKKWTRQSKSPDGTLLQRGFNMFVLDPIYKILNSIMDLDQITTLLSKLEIQLTNAEMELDKRRLLQLIMQRFLPCDKTLFDTICIHLPSPIAAQVYRNSILYEGPVNDSLCQVSCDPMAPLMFYTSQMVPDGNGHFYALGRVFSGTVRTGVAVCIMGPNYRYRSDQPTKTIQKIVLFSTSSIQEIDSCPAGHIVGLGGIDECLVRYSTLSTAKTPHIFKTIKVSPIVQVAVDVLNTSDLPKLIEGLKCLARTDSCVVTSLTGQHFVAGTGQYHLDLRLKDLKHTYAKVPLKIGDPIIQYRETITSTRTSMTCMSKSRNKRNRLFMSVERMGEELSLAIENGIINPQDNFRNRAQQLVDEYGWDKQCARKIWCFGPDETGANLLVDATKSVQYLNEIKDSCISAFQWATKAGPLIEENVRGCRFNIMDLISNTDVIHRGYGQLLPTCRRVIHASILSAQPGIQEPINLMQLQCHVSSADKAYDLIRRHRGKLISEEQLFDTSVYITAYFPAAESFGFTQRTSGIGFPQFRFDHWQLLSGNQDDLNNTIKQVRITKGLAADLPTLDDYIDRW